MAAKFAEHGQWVVSQAESGSITVSRVYDNTKEGLRQLSQEVGFSYDESWTTRQFGSKLIEHINGK